MKHAKIKRRVNLSLIVGLMILFLVGVSGCSSENDSQTDKSSSTKVVKKTKYIGKDKYNIAKKENVALLAKEKKLSEQADKLDEQKDKIESDEAAAKQKAEAEQEEQQKAAAEQQKQAQTQQNQQSSQSRGDMNTSSSGQIVGNVNSHIYHVPGQRGYKMNSSNAVYFNTEQDAINAGYRKAKV